MVQSMRKRYGINFWLLAVLVLSAVLWGCNSSKSRVGTLLNLDTDLKLTFKVDANVNPDDNNRPSPVFVRLYQLKSPTAFEKADFIDIYEQDTKVLAADLVSQEKLKAFTPGQTRVERLVLNPGVRYIALYVEFAQFSGANYKVVFPVTENNVIRNQEIIALADRSITLQAK